VVPTGSSVVLRAFSLMLMLGYHKFHVFGFDSCLRGDAHHAYAQQENDGQHVTPVTCGTKIFYCHPWMVSQAQEFQDLMRIIGEHVDVEVYGDGLIAEIINHGAQLAEAQEFDLS
jgi:predicted small metal-binding protein